MIRWAMLGLLLLAPSAAAAVELRVEPAQVGPFPPEGMAELLVTLTVDCESILMRAPEPGGPLPVELQAHAPNSNIITQFPEVEVPPCDEAAATQTVTVPAAVGATRELPGLKPFQIAVEARLPPLPGVAPPLDGDDEDTAEFVFIADAFQQVQARMDQQIKQAAPGKDVPFEVVLANFGNVRMQFRFAVAEGDPAALQLPEDLILFSPTNPLGATEQTVVVTANAKGANHEHRFRLRIEPMAADDPEQTMDPMYVNMVLRTRSASGMLAPFVLVAALVVAGGLLVARAVQRKRGEGRSGGGP